MMKRREFLTSFGGACALIGSARRRNEVSSQENLSLELHYASLSRVARLIEQRVVSPVEVTRHSTQRASTIAYQLKAEFEEMMDGKTYSSSIPSDVAPPTLPNPYQNPDFEPGPLDYPTWKSFVLEREN